MNIDPLTIGMLVVLAILIFFMFRNSRKRRADQEKLRDQIVPGAEIMTNFGLFGTLKSIDEVSNVAEVETSPGNIVRVHRQTIAKVVEPITVAEGEPRSVEEAMAIANREAEERERAAAAGASEEAPAYGERISTEAKKPVRRTTKKVSE
jgi:preprotein translocase subunit YajC